MTDADRPDTSRTSRPRPSYGLPGPTPEPGAAPGTSDARGADAQGQAPSSPTWGSPQSDSSRLDDAPARDAAEPPAAAWASPVPAGEQPHGAGPAPRRRRGLWPLITGLVLMLILAPGVTIGGFVWGIGSMVGDFADGPVTMEGGTADVEVPANQMVVIYVPTEEADGATCTATSADGSADSLTVVPTSGEATFPNGVSYTQKAGVMAMDDATVTLSCEGTDAPAYMGPFSMWGVVVPILVGVLLGLLLGLIGLVLTIVGIVKLVRSRRA